MSPISRLGRRLLIAVAVVVVLLGAGAGFAAAYLHSHPWWIDDEWTCSHGEVPVVAVHGTGAMCLRKGATVPAGFRLDPLGNRPLDCDGRSGWIVVEADAGRHTRDCFPSRQPIPSGWHRASG